MLLNSTNLRKFRDAQKLSQDELAELLNLSQSTISDWEKRDCNVKLEHVIKLAEVLHVTLDKLLIDSTGVQNIQNIHTVQSDAIVGYNVKVDNRKNEKEVIEFLKSAIKTLENAMKQMSEKNKGE